jgi:hypothetical protein
MSEKKKLDPSVNKDCFLFNNVTVSGTTTYTSPAIEVSNYDNLALKISWTGTMAGTVNFLTSVDRTTWDALSFPSPAPPSPSGSTLSYTIPFGLLPYFQFQIQYVNASGSGTMYAVICGKDLN